MDFPLSSSVILVIAVALWLVWVAPYVLRNGRYQLQPAVEFMTDAPELEPVDHQAGRVLKMTAHQENSVTGIPGSEPAGRGGGVQETPKRPPSAPVFRIRYARLALALAGVVSLLTGAVSAGLRIFGVGPAWLPVAALLATGAAVMLLRRLAVRDRRRKVDAAFRAAMNARGPRHPVQSPAPQSAPGRSPGSPDATASASRQRPESQLFDAQSGAGTPGPAPLPAPNAPRVLTGQELRQAALAEAAATGDTPVPLTPEGSSWDPVEVPKPTYVEAPKAERAAPGPLDLPEAPKAAGKPSLKQGLAHGASRVVASEVPTAGASDSAAGKSQSALGNLDDVLQRRRA